MNLKRIFQGTPSMVFSIGLMLPGLFSMGPVRYDRKPENLFGDAVVAYAQGHFDVAAAKYSLLIQRDPKTAFYYNNRGLAYAEMKQYDLAIADYTETLTLNPVTPENPDQYREQSATVHFNRGLSYQGKGTYDKALADYRTCLDLSPSSYEIWNNIAWTLATAPQAALRDGKKAVEAAKKSCEMSNWGYPAAVDTLAAAYAEVGDFDSAIKWEQSYLATPKMSAEDVADGKKRLELYQAHKPDREK